MNDGQWEEHEQDMLDSFQILLNNAEDTARVIRDMIDGYVRELESMRKTRLNAKETDIKLQRQRAILDKIDERANTEIKEAKEKAQNEIKNAIASMSELQKKKIKEAQREATQKFDNERAKLLNQMQKLNEKKKAMDEEMAIMLARENNVTEKEARADKIIEQAGKWMEANKAYKKENEELKTKISVSDAANDKLVNALKTSEARYGKLKEQHVNALRAIQATKGLVQKNKKIKEEMDAVKVKHNRLIQVTKPFRDKILILQQNIAELKEELATLRGVPTQATQATEGKLRL